MLIFCPLCDNILRQKPFFDATTSEQTNRFECPTCTYCFPLKGYRLYEQTLYTPKQPEAVRGGPDAWKHAEKMDVTCAAKRKADEGPCEGSQALFKQMQIRSADEPMSTIYKCLVCEGEWFEK